VEARETLVSPVWRLAGTNHCLVNGTLDCLIHVGDVADVGVALGRLRILLVGIIEPDYRFVIRKFGFRIQMAGLAHHAVSLEDAKSDSTHWKLSCVVRKADLADDKTMLEGLRSLSMEVTEANACLVNRKYDCLRQSTLSVAISLDGHPGSGRSMVYENTRPVRHFSWPVCSRSPD
jgi:hypothetical protein